MMRILALLGLVGAVAGTWARKRVPVLRVDFDSILSNPVVVHPSGEGT